MACVPNATILGQYVLRKPKSNLEIVLYTTERTSLSKISPLVGKLAAAPFTLVRISSVDIESILCIYKPAPKNLETNLDSKINFEANCCAVKYTVTREETLLEFYLFILKLILLEFYFITESDSSGGNLENRASRCNTNATKISDWWICEGAWGRPLVGVALSVETQIKY
ncbi:hypothetical protein WN51_00762 [Melipona quadrifasciata]|uniref:Uncharacterized protein n=1 Tax=Melipona quadrifasciata TaxID=166423 RepID=A0A0N0BFB0_9HYME|nr:hypothetical protein WN51_00762 [Melipona quadrifasciata]